VAVGLKRARRQERLGSLDPGGAGAEPDHVASRAGSFKTIGIDAS
jgi:hypothetical protein